MAAGENAMAKTIVGAGLALAALPVAAIAQGGEPAAAAGGCYVEVAILLSDPPTGIGELGAAIRELDVRLRPQVDEVNATKALIARIEQRIAARSETSEGVSEVAFGIGDQPTAPLTEESETEELQRLHAELQDKQTRLEQDYAAQKAALVAPVQARVSQRAEVFAAECGCAGLAMARARDLDALKSAGSRDVTGEFVSWYLASGT